MTFPPAEGFGRSGSRTPTHSATGIFRNASRLRYRQASFCRTTVRSSSSAWRTADFSRFPSQESRGFRLWSAASQRARMRSTAATCGSPCSGSVKSQRRPAPNFSFSPPLIPRSTQGLAISFARNRCAFVQLAVLRFPRCPSRTRNRSCLADACRPSDRRASCRPAR